MARLRRLAAYVRIAAAAALLLFHVALFWMHLTQGRLMEPAVALRWGLALLLLGVLWLLRRVGVPLLWGRRALVLWVLVALLHVSAAGAASDALTTSPADAALSIVVLPPAAGLIFMAGVLLLGALAARGWRLPLPLTRPVRPSTGTRLRSAITSPRLAPRAPPLPVIC